MMLQYLYYLLTSSFNNPWMDDTFTLTYTSCLFTFVHADRGGFQIKAITKYKQCSMVYMCEPSQQSKGEQGIS